MFDKVITRWCCPGKQDFETTLYLYKGFDPQTGVPIIGYRRESNDDWYFGPFTNEVELRDSVADPYFIP